MKNILIGASVILVFIFMGCEKFPEGPGFTLRTTQKRIHGDWEITSYKIDGVESINSSNWTSRKFFFNGGKLAGDMHITINDCDTCGVGVAGLYTLHEKILTTSLYISADHNPFEYFSDTLTQSNTYTSAWNVQMLKKKQMILESIDEYDLNKVRMELKRY
tara:strand:+ start:49 stop:531 length:483 start_codon:yes stop_codon:yes gene_type:complete